MRYVPIINRGLVSGTIVMSDELGMAEAQRRVDNYTIATRQWRLVGLTPYDWVAVSLPLPQDIQNDMLELVRYRVTQRGGMQEAYRIRYKYVHDPECTHVYEFYDTQAVLAEMVCDFAVDILCAPHQILLLRSTHVPSLDEHLVSFENVVLYLVDLRFIYHWTAEDAWMWPPSVLENATRLQRADVMDYENNTMPRPRTMPNMPMGQPTSIQPFSTGGSLWRDEVRGREQQGRDQRSFRRGGVRERPTQNPRQQMMAWAVDKVRAHAPQAEGPTLKMLLKAEARVATSLMNSKSPTQTKEILNAAWKRAGLQSPFQPTAQQSPVCDATQLQACHKRIDDMVTALTEQVKITQHIAIALQDIPRIAQFEALMSSTSQSQTSYIDTVRALAEAVGKLENRIQEWETTCLPHLVERMPMPSVPTPETEESMEQTEEGSPKRTKMSQEDDAV